MVAHDVRLESLGEFIRAQRKLANLSLRQMADLAHVSNPYLSQLERGLHEPSVRVLQSIAEALERLARVLLRPGRRGADDGAASGNATTPTPKPPSAATPGSPTSRSRRCSACTAATSGQRLSNGTSNGTSS